MDVAGGAPEPSLGKIYDLRLIRRFWHFIRPHRRTFWLSLACLPVSSALMLAQPLLLKLAVDRHVATGRADGLATMGILFLLAAIGEVLLVYWQYYLTMTVAQNTLADLRVALFSHVERLPAGYLESNPLGRLVTRLTSDVDVLNEMFAAGAITLVMDLLTMAAIVGIMLSIDFKLALWALAFLPLLLLAVNYFRIVARYTYRRIRVCLARINTYLQESLSGMAIIQLFAREGATFEEFRALNDAHRLANHKSNIYEAALFSMVEALASVSVASMLWFGGPGILKGTIAFGTLVAFVEYIQRFFVPIREFSIKYAVLQAAMAAAERIFELLDTPVGLAVLDKPHAAGRIEGKIEFRDVWFAYRGDDYVLRGVSFRVEPGQTVAVVGPTGAGKSTLIKLLERFYDVTQGAVLLDGVDVREWDPASLRRQVGVVPQDVFLFRGDIRSNITLGRDEVGERDIQEAVRAANAAGFIGRMEGGLHARVRERGSNLSAGERQLLAFARVLAYNPRVLVLDEATSSVDAESELLIQDAVGKLFRGRTALVIAHRLSTIRRADRIVVLHKGVVRESGTHEELMAAKGIYFTLYRLQQGRQMAGAEAQRPSEAV